MKTQVVVGWLYVILGGTLALPACADEKAEALLQKVDATMRATKTLTADFSRTHTNCTVFNGKLRLMKPNFARIEWTDPKPGAAPLYAVSDGKTLWRYPYSAERQYVMQKADPTGVETVQWMDGVPIQAFFNPSTLLSPEATKAMKYQGRQQWEGKEYQVVEETGDGDGDPDRGYTCQLFIGNDFLIHRYLNTFHRKRKDGTPSTLELALRNIHTNVRMTVATFAYTPPPDAKPAEKVAKAVQPVLLTNGTPAPDFILPGKEGKPLKLSDYRGRVVVLDFWATWCAPCMQSLPHTTAMAKKYGDKNVVVLAVNVWDTRKAFDGWIPAHPQYAPLTFALDAASDSKDVATRLYHVSNIPTQYIIDPNGLIVASINGFDEKSNVLEEAIIKACQTAQ